MSCTTLIFQSNTIGDAVRISSVPDTHGTGFFWTNQPHRGLNSFILIGPALPNFSSQLCRWLPTDPTVLKSVFPPPAGTPVTRVTATDADDPVYGNSAKLVYSILEGQPYFSIDPNSGKCGSVFSYNRNLSLISFPWAQTLRGLYSYRLTFD